MPLAAVSLRADEIYDAVREKILKNAESYPPGLLEQYNTQIRRIEEQAPGCEFISFPGFASLPNPPKPVYALTLRHWHCLTLNARTASI